MSQEPALGGVELVKRSGGTEVRVGRPRSGAGGWGSLAAAQGHVGRAGGGPGGSLLPVLWAQVLSNSRSRVQVLAPEP